MEDEAHIGEGKEFHTFGADELKASEPVIVRTRLMKQVLVGGAQWSTNGEKRWKPRQVRWLVKSNSCES
jgi:hypothetical protein